MQTKDRENEFISKLSLLIECPGFCFKSSLQLRTSIIDFELVGEVQSIFQTCKLGFPIIDFEPVREVQSIFQTCKLGFSIIDFKINGLTNQLWSKWDGRSKISLSIK